MTSHTATTGDFSLRPPTHNKKALLLGSGVALLLWAQPPTARADAAPTPSTGGIASQSTDAQSADAASTSVQTVIVTAEKRSENIQNVPASVSAVTGSQIEKLNLVDIFDIAQHIPNFNIIQGNNNRNTAVIIRGIGSSGTNPGIEPDVGIFLDGVYLPAAGAIYANLNDISTLEVLRGPQGTLYGRNTPVGAVNITTRVPTQGFEAMGNVDVGNYGERRVDGYVGGGLAANLAVRVSAYVDDHSGYETNLFNNAPINGSDQYGARVRLRWTPQSNLTVDFTSYYSKINSNCCASVQLNPTGPGGIATPGFLGAAAAIGAPFTHLTSGDLKVDDSNNPEDFTTMWGSSANVNLALSDGITLTSITAYNYFDDDIASLDSSSLPQDMANANADDRINLVTQEFRITSPNDKILTYVGGIYLLHQDLAYVNDLSLLAGSNRVFNAGGAMVKVGDTSDSLFAQRTDGAAAYGQATLHLFNRLRLIGGLRYSYDAKRANDFGTSFNNLGGAASPVFLASFPDTNAQLSRVDKSVNWLAAAQFDVTNDVMLYATSGNGYKDGGFNARTAPVGFPLTFGPETSLTYEGGVKSTWFEKRLLIDADVFDMTINGFQASETNPAGTGFIVGNAGDQRVEGLELQTELHPIEQWTIGANLAYDHAQYTNYPDGPCITTYPVAGSPPPAGKPPLNPAHPGSCNYNGFTPAINPRLTWSANTEWRQLFDHWDGVAWFVQGSVEYAGSRFLDPTLDPRSFQPAVALLDAQVGIESSRQRWRVSLYGRNLTNQIYYTAVSPQVLGAFANAGGTAAANGFQGWYAPPRVFGIDLKYTY